LKIIAQTLDFWVRMGYICVINQLNKKMTHESTIKKTTDFFREFKEKQGSSGLRSFEIRDLFKKHGISPNRVYAGIALGYVEKTKNGGRTHYKCAIQNVSDGQSKKILAYANENVKLSMRKARGRTDMTAPIAAPTKEKTPSPNRIKELVSELKSLGYTGKIEKVMSIEF
jgi:hypothetical protein